MKQKLNKILGGLFIVATIAVASNKAFAFGEHGCYSDPINPTGQCHKTIEGNWVCLDSPGGALDCTERWD
jgi:hypothetical protein